MAVSAGSAGQGKSDFESSARAAGSSMSDKAAEMSNRAGHQVDRALDSAEAAARNMAEQGREASERVSQVAGNMRIAVDKSVREQPGATLMVAVALGFVLGALWKS